jgi:hypothetical protein
MQKMNPPEWIAETDLREVLVGRYLTAPDSQAPLFWINLRSYGAHADLKLEGMDWFRHWHDVYECCRRHDMAALARFPYLSILNPECLSTGGLMN